jgi:phenylacetate-CoA ligase
MTLFEKVIYFPGVRHGLGLLANNFGFYIAERYQNRSITKYVRDLKNFYRLPYEEQRYLQRQRLADVISFASYNVPYYKDVFTKRNIQADKIRKDEKYIADIPFLTKEIIREQGNRLLSADLTKIKHFACKTGGSTGLSCTIYYNQEAADRSAAITRFSRLKVGKRWHRSELHFACDFGEAGQRKFWQAETLKCAAMNRSNIFFSNVDDEGLGCIYAALQQRRAFLVHGHPSTMYQLALYVEARKLPGHLFSIFESSGEYLSPKMEAKIKSVFGCHIHNRYGLAEFGIVAYQELANDNRLRVFTSDVFCETASQNNENELVFTSLSNRLMPLIRYRSGDLVAGKTCHDGRHLQNLMGRIHDKVTLGSRTVFTHHIQDLIDHRIGGVAEFQILERGGALEFLILPENYESRGTIREKCKIYFPEASLRFVNSDAFVRVGRHAKFRHLVSEVGGE